jgi:hypothetical protein
MRCVAFQRYYGFKCASILLLAIGLALLSGCGSSKKEAQSLVKQGIATTDQLTKYYDSLVQANTRYVHIQTFDLVGFDDERTKDLLLERKAYASRADLARKLNATYVALGQLIDFDAAADIKKPVEDLTTAVLKQLPLPGELNSEIFKTVITKIAGRLVEIKQEKKFRKNAPRVLEVLDGVAEIFERERPLYVMTVQLYEERASGFAIKLMGNGECKNSQGSAIGTLEELYQPYTVKPFGIPPTTEAICDKNFKGFKALIVEMAKDRKVAAEQQARSISQSLYNLERSHRGFLREAPNAPALLAADLINVDQFLATIKDVMAARADWESKHKSKGTTKSHHQSASTNGNGDGTGTTKPEYEPAKPVADYVATLLSPKVKDAIEKDGDTSSNAFRKQLLEDLNRIIETGNILEGILSKDGQAILLQCRTNSDANKRDELKDSLAQAVSKILVKSTGQPPDSLTDLVADDPAGKPLARLNRAILAFVFADSVAAQKAAKTIAD